MSKALQQMFLGTGSSPYGRVGLIIQGAILIAATGLGIYLYNSCQAYSTQERAQNVRSALIVGMIAGIVEIIIGGAR